MTTERQFIAADEAEEPFFVGVDVGGTSIKIGIVDNLGRSLGALAIPTESHTGPEEAAQRIATALRQLISEVKLSLRDIEFIGLGTPGTLDISAGLILGAHNLPGWSETPIRDLLTTACDTPAVLVNDANAAAYGEFWVGSGQAFRSMVLFTLGTGIGGGIIVGDTLIEGENSAGAELGHILIDYHETARLCGCGHRGHLEAYCSAVAVVKRAEELLASDVITSLRGRIANGEQLTPKMIADEAAEEDELALEIIDDTARYLAVGIVTVLHTVDPAAVVLGGAMNFGGNDSPVGRRFLARVQQEVALRALEPLATRTMIDFATLGGDAGYIGAAGIARLEYMKYIK